MRLSERLRVERRLAAAETVVASRAMARVTDFLQTEITDLPVHRARAVLLAATRAAKSGAATRDAVRVLLTEIALVEPRIAARIAAALGVELRAPGASPRG